MEIAWWSIFVVGGIVITWMWIEGIRRSLGYPPAWKIFRDWVNSKFDIDPDETMCPYCGKTQISKNWTQVIEPNLGKKCLDHAIELFLECQSCGWFKFKYWDENSEKLIMTRSVMPDGKEIIWKRK